MKNRKKLLWIAGGILLAFVLCVLMAHLGGGVIEMMKAHMGM